MSSHNLSESDTSLLSRGLNFAPTVPPNPFTLFVDLNRFSRNLTVMRFYNIQAAKKGTTNIDTNSPSSSYDDDIEETTILSDDIALAYLEELYNNDNEDYASYLTQHMPTSPAVKHTNFHPKSIFNPTYAKGPFVQSFYQVVFVRKYDLCARTPTISPDRTLLHQRQSLYDN